MHAGLGTDMAALFETHESDRFSLHKRRLNEQMVRVLKTIGYDVGFCKGRGQYLYDRADRQYLDLLSGFGVFALGRNHPKIRAALKSALDADLPNLVQMDVSTLAGILADRLLDLVPHLDKVFFANSGAESVEAAIKFARAATRRPGIAYCSHAFHGLTYGALSLNGDDTFRHGFEPLLPDCVCVPFNDLAALDRALSNRRMALFVVDEIQTGIGRTGKFLAGEHYDIEPVMVLLAKALSGGHVPVGAVLMRKAIHDKVFNRMDRAVVHGSTFSKNDLAMAAGIATLEVLKAERITENAALMGERLLRDLSALTARYELLKEVRGKGLMIGVEFGAPSSFKLKASWAMLETASKGLFCQLITIPLFKEHKILTQVAGT